jgi:hypothetical protein
MSAQPSLPFGRHKGTAIDEVPPDYLAWLLANTTNLRPNTKAMIEESLARRGGTAPAARAPKKKAAPAGAESDGPIPCPACGAMLRVTLGEALDPDKDVPF